MYIWIRYGDII